MRSFLHATLLAAPLVLSAQTAPAPTATQPAQELSRALTGDWTGVLEYRDYSEPPASAKRVQLPTWLSIRPTGPTLSLE